MIYDRLSLLKEFFGRQLSKAQNNMVDLSDTNNKGPKKVGLTGIETILKYNLPVVGDLTDERLRMLKEVAQNTRWSTYKGLYPVCKEYWSLVKEPIIDFEQFRKSSSKSRQQ